MKKILSLLLVLSLISMTGLVSAQEYSDDIESFPDQTATYGQDATITLQCPGNQCPEPEQGQTHLQLNIDGCTRRQSYAFVYRGSATSEMDVTYNIPTEYSCGVGEYDMQVMYGNEVRAEATLDVQAKNMDPHKGQYIYIVSDINNNNLEDFILSNDIWEDTLSPFWGNKENPEADPCATLPGGEGCFNSAVMVEDVDTYSGNEFASWNVDYGEKITPSTSDSIESIVNGSVYDGKERYSGGAIGDDNCSNDPCALGKASFTTDNNINGLDYGRYAGTLESSTPIETGVGERMPEGEVIYGEEPVYYDENGEQFVDSYESQPTRKFFICREGATMKNGFGHEVPQVVDTNSDYEEEDLVQCNEFSGTWSPVDECDDGIDNDGDGTIDETNQFSEVPTDPDCQISNSEDPITPPCEEEARVMENQSTGELYALYNTGDGCQTTDYSDASSVMSDGDPFVPVLFSCEPGSTNPDCSSDFGDGDNEHGEMLHVDYFAHSEYFRQLANATNTNLVTEGVSTDFVEQNNGWVTQTQGLHTAEQKYDEDQQGIGMNPGNCNNCHNYTWWNSLNVTNIESYQNGNIENHQEAWEVANAGAKNDKVDSASNPESEVAVFDGGFAGKCEDGNEWQYSNTNLSWICTGTEIKEDITIGDPPTDYEDPEEIPDFGTSVYLPETESFNDNGETRKEIGLIQFPYINQGNLPDYVPGGVYSYPNLEDGDQIDQVVAECWAGSIDDKPENPGSSDRYVSGEASPSSDDVWGIVGEINYSGDYTGYACRWGYETEQKDSLVIGDSDASVVEMHRNQEAGSEYYTFWTALKNQYNLQEEYGPNGLSQELS